MYTALAKQQLKTAQETFTYKVKIITGEQNVDSFNGDKWHQLMNDNQIFVMTVQVFHDAVASCYINLEQVNVIVFDECHHGRKGHPMHQIMQMFDGKDMSGCRVIGLSGMLIGVDNKIKCLTVREDLRQLEATFQSTIITVNNLNDQQNSLLHSTKAKEFFIEFTMPIKDACITEIFNRMAKLIEKLAPIKLDKVKTLNPKTLQETIPKSIKDLIRLFKDVQYQVEHMGAYGVYLDLLSVLIQLEISKRYKPTQKFRSIVKMCITVVEQCIHKMKIELKIHKKDAETIRTNSSEKIVKLIKALIEMFTDKNREKDLQCLVFTQRRSTSKALYHLCKYYVEFSTHKFPMKPDFVVSF
jgi:ERCC4-related helicase